MNHRDPGFLDIVRQIKTGLLAVYPGTLDWSACLLGGSGTAAVEAMITSCIGKGPTLILESGYYSARIANIFRVHNMSHQTLSFGWLHPWDMPLVESLVKGGNFESVVCVHHETTTGRLNPVAELGAMCRLHGLTCLVDAMSSFGADDLFLGDVDAVCASANKCLHGVPGVSFVLCKPGMSEYMASVAPRSFYLSLAMYLGDEPPMTPPVPALEALAQALVEFPGQEARRERYRLLAGRIRSAVARHELGLAVPEADSSCSLTCVELPNGWSSDAWLTGNRERQYLLYGCKEDLKERFFQVANMGDLNDDQVEGWVDTLDDLLKG